MNRSSRFGTAISTLAIAAVISGCSTGQQSRESIFGAKVDRSNIGLATRAQSALAEGQLATAVALAERAVENTPNDAGFRSLLGNIYFASGRFASAETAYRDSLSLVESQPELILKLALVQIAQGKIRMRLRFFQLRRTSSIRPTRASRWPLPAEPTTPLQFSTRSHARRAPIPGSARIWRSLRSFRRLDDGPDRRRPGRTARPARFADRAVDDDGDADSPVGPGRGADRSDSAADPGQPLRLALNPTPQPNRAQAQAVVLQAQPQPQPQAQQFAELPAAPPPALPEPQPEMPVAEAPPLPPVIEAPAPVVAEAAAALLQPVPQPLSLPEAPAVPEPAVVEAPLVQAVAEPVPELPTSFEAPVQPASYVAISDTVRRAAKGARKANGRSISVVQLGAYGSPERVSVAWTRISRKYPALARYTPMRARFAGPNGTVWRLSIKGFSSQKEAVDRCELLQSRGGSCFVRIAAGDSQVQFASR